MKPLKKVNNEIQKIDEQMELLSERRKELEAQRTQLENAEMISAIRNAKFNADEMLEVIAALKKGGKGLSHLLPAEADEEPGKEGADNE